MSLTVVKKDLQLKRRVKKVGSSLMVSMTEALKKINLDIDDPVIITVNEDTQEIIIKRDPSFIPGDLDPLFLEMIQKSVQKHDGVYKKLKDM